MLETFYAHKADLVLLHKAGLSYHLLRVLMIRFHFDDISSSGSEQNQFAASYHIGGIFNNMLLWFSHDMKETPQEMTDIAISYRPEESLTLFNL